MNQTLDTSLSTKLKIVNFFSNRYSDSIYYEKSKEILNSTLNVKNEKEKMCTIYKKFLDSLKNIGIPIANTIYASNLLSEEEDLNNLKGIQIVNRILKKVNAKIYLASENTLNYALPSEYHVDQVWIQKFTASPYPQINLNTENEFIPNLSILDMISFLNKDQILNNLDRSNQWVKYIN